MEKKKRWSSKQKVGVILRLLRGEDVESLSRELKVVMKELIKWRDNFLDGGEKALSRQKEHNPEILEYQKLLARTQVELELLKKNMG